MGRQVRWRDRRMPVVGVPPNWTLGGFSAWLQDRVTYRTTAATSGLVVEGPQLAFQNRDRLLEQLLLGEGIRLNNGQMERQPAETTRTTLPAGVGVYLRCVRPSLTL